MKVQKKTRIFVDEHLQINDYSDIEEYFAQLRNADINCAKELEWWLKKNSELEAVIRDDAAWRYIHMTSDTSDEQAQASYSNFMNELYPRISEQFNLLYKKLHGCPHKISLGDPADQIYFKKIETEIEIFREANIDLQAKASTLTRKYSAVMGGQLITYDGVKLTPQQAAVYLRDPDRRVRQEVFDLLQNRMMVDNDKLEDIFDQLLKMRHQIALNAGFENFRDYQFKAKNRVDYSVQDCFDFHTSIEEHIVPITKTIMADKLSKLGFDTFRPWDILADPDGKRPLKPFETGEELLQKTIAVFERIDPYFSDCLITMNEVGHLDLESKKGKAPGGFCFSFYETGIPFIFMNAANSALDVITMVHEGGHAVHSFLKKDLKLTAYKYVPSEVAELASKSMELLSMKYWGCYYPENEELVQAQRDYLESRLSRLSWIATIDSFQHWIYENPDHSREERKGQWIELGERFGTGLIDWSGYEDGRNYSWHKQLHLFQFPLYFIEYGFSQLGSLGVWENSLTNEKEAVQQYKEALSLGHTRDIKSIYKAAGVEFDFSAENIKSLANHIIQFLKEIK